MATSRVNQKGTKDAGSIKPSLWNVSFPFLIVLLFIFLILFGWWQISFEEIIEIIAAPALTIILYVLYYTYKVQISWHADVLLFNGIFMSQQINLYTISRFDTGNTIIFRKARELYIWAYGSDEPAVKFRIDGFSVRDLTLLANQLRQATGSARYLVIRPWLFGKAQKI